MRNIKLWQAGALAAVVALIAGAGVWLYQRNQNTAQAEALPNAARIQRVEGEVALNESLRDDNADTWTAASPNQSFSVGDRLYTRDNSRASLATSGRNYVRLDPNSSLDAVVLTDDRTQFALREGSALFDVGYLPSNGLYEVGTPYGAVDFHEPGLYQVDLSEGNAMVSVLSGLAQVAGLGDGGRISKGEMLTLLGTTAAEVVLSRLNNDDAGYLVDDYYRDQYPNSYDGRYAAYDAYLDDPYYYDPYRRNVSYQHVSQTIPGVNDLDYYGDWVQVNDHGYAWRPRVDSAWAPYQTGHWTNDYPYGMTWVSNEPWGYAPYHYGRWANVNNQWMWIPDGVNTAPRYSPALVAFLPVNDNAIGWVPLGPGDPYAVRYYDENWQPHYLTQANLDGVRLANWAVPNAVTVVPIDAFGRQIDPRMVMRVNPQTIAQVRPTLDPLLLTPLRNAALNSAWGRGKIDVPPGIAKKLRDTPVVLNDTAFSPRFKKNLAKSLRVEKVKDHKLKVKDERNVGVTHDAARGRRLEALNGEVARGNKDARKQVRELERQQRKDQPRVLAPQGERVGNPARPKAHQPKVEKGQPEAPRRSAAPAPAASKHSGQQPPGQSKGAGGGGKGKGKKP